MAAPSNTFTGNVLKLVTGNVFAQALGIILAPVAARLFSPEAFGVAGIFASIAAVLSVLTCLRYESAVILPKSDAEAANLLGLCLCIVLLTTFATLLIFVAAGGAIARALKVPELGRYLWLMPVSVFFSGLFVAFNSWNSRTKRFGRLSLNQVFASLVTQASKLGMGFAGHVSGGIIIGTTVLGNAVSAVLLGGQLWREDGRMILASTTFKGLAEGCKRYKKFPLYNTWSMLLSTASTQLPNWMLAFYFSPVIVGFYSLGRTVLAIPAGLIGNAIGQVFVQRAAEAHNERNDLPIVVEGVFKRLVSLGIFPVFMITLIGEDMFRLVFGSRWAEAGIYTQILGTWTFCSLISAPLSSLSNVLELQHVGFVFNVVLFVTRFLCLVAGGVMGNVYLTLGLLSGTGTLAFLWLGLWFLSRVHVPLSRVAGILAQYTVYSIPLLGVTAFSKWGLRAKPLWTVAVGSLMIFPYYFIVWRTDPLLQGQLRLALQKAVHRW